VTGTNGKATLPVFYPIVDAETTEDRGWTVADLSVALFDGGATWVQLRCPQHSLSQFLTCADTLVERAARYGALVIINDRVDVATMSGAAGVHVGQDDLMVTAVKDLLPPRSVIGLSTHTTEQLAESLLLKVDYAAVGPIYETRTKDTGYAAVGLGAIKRARTSAGTLPIVAVGGITVENAADVLAAGASSVSVISDVFSGGNPTQRTRAYLERLSV
jgi:thiamine-phosphate pyrophosphorylase